MPGPYYDNWFGPNEQQPSSAASPEEIESIQTVEDVRRLFPDYPAKTDAKKTSFSAGTPREQRTPQALAQAHVGFVKRFNPYTFEPWAQVWWRAAHQKKQLRLRLLDLLRRRAFSQAADKDP